MGRSKPMFDRLLDGLGPSDIDGRDAWWRVHSSLAGETPVTQALLAGAAAPRVAYAFASGYQCALRAMFGVTEIATLAITEAGGAHPKSIETRFSGGLLDGVKTFATLGPWATRAFVLARGDAGLVMTSVSGFTAEPLPATPFAPEIPHGVLRFASTPAELLEGDGYSRYTKPFRTVEDVYVHMALIGCVFHAADRVTKEKLLACASALESLSEQDWLARSTHLALAGLLPYLRDLVTPFVPESDRPLLFVAEKIREKRTKSAWG